MQCFVRGGTRVNVSLWPGGSKWLPSGLREAIGCVCIEERDALDRGPLPSDGDREKSHVGPTKGWHRSDGSGVGWAVCAWVTYQFSPTTVDRLRVLGPAREGISFWFSRLNAEVSVN